MVGANFSHAKERAMPREYFTPATLRFLRALAKHNDRTWFLAHKAQYDETLRLPFLRLIGDLAEPLRKISPHYVADPKPVGGSLFRIHRDTRFAKDKTPYKTWASAQFFHEATRNAPRADDTGDGRGRLDAPVFYLHVQPGQGFTGGGLWHPQPQALQRVRDYMVGNPRSWKSATRSPRFRKLYELGGEALSRPPRGFDPAHELIEELKRKSFTGSTPLSDAELLSPKLPALLIRRWTVLTPLMDWLCGALELDF
jgi:uncharacterized protein (TIGR02453 family)